MDFIEESFDDFDEFLDKIEDAKPQTIIQDDETANYYVGRIKRNRNMISMYKEKAKAIKEYYLDKTKQYEESKTASLENDSERCLALLKEYYDSIAQNDKTKIRLPEGNIGFYKVPQSIKIEDEDAVLDFLNNMDNFDVSSYIENIPSLNKKAFKNAGIVDMNTFKFNNEVVPGITVIPSENKFNVR